MERYRYSTAGNPKGEHCHGYEHPSFSSTLLDAIYRSIDESSHDIRPSSRSRSQSLLRGDEVCFGNGGSLTKCSSASMDRRSRVGDAGERKSRDRIVDQWRQNTPMIDDDEDLVIRRRSLPPETTTEFAGVRSSVMASNRRRSLGSLKEKSSPASSSDSSTGGRLSSSDADFFYAAKKKNNALKPIRTSISDHRSETFRSADPRPPKSDSAGKSAKSRAMKLYGDLKRMKQPISPGGKLASFLNSLFSASGGSKKQKTTSSDTGRWERDSKSNFTANTTPSCSTASSYSRSCLSKRPSSAGRYDCGVKRSVRFCPVSVIVDEDLKPCGHKSLRGSETVDAKNRRVEEMARDLLRSYHQRTNREFAAPRKDGVEELRKISRDQNMVGDGEDDDMESCCSSDLFELEIGVDRYCEELPVYETTRVDKNRAIATGMIA